VHSKLEPYDKENEFLKDAINWLHKQQDIKTIRINDSCHRGYSDLFLCVRGIFVALELKDNKGTPSTHQKVFIQDILLTGGVAKIVTTMQEVEACVDYARHRSDVYTK
jgi:hypothetical protein